MHEQVSEEKRLHLLSSMTSVAMVDNARYTFSMVNSVPSMLLQMTVGLTFENFHQLLFDDGFGWCSWHSGR
jgi:hypothetical protein